MNKEEQGLQKIIAESQARIHQAKVNMKFAKLTPAAKRVAIMEDVLALLKAPNGIQVKQGIYCQISSDESIVDLQDVVINDPSSCTVCGIGAIFLAHAQRFNSIKLIDESYGGIGADDTDIIKALAGYFSKDQLRLIETAFEGSVVCGLDSGKYDPMGVEWIDKYDDDRVRLKAIAQNVIRNKGTFVITQVVSSRK